MLLQRDCADGAGVGGSSSLGVANSSASFLGVLWLAANQPALLTSASTTSLGYCRTFLPLYGQRKRSFS